MSAANLLSILLVLPILATAADDFDPDTRTSDSRASETRAEVNAAGGAENYIRALVREFNRKLPKQLDESTSLVGASSHGRQFNLIYRIQKIRSKDDFENVASGYQRYTTREICFSPEGNVLISEFDVTYRYIYLSKAGRNLFEFIIDKVSCDQFRVPFQIDRENR